MKNRWMQFLLLIVGLTILGALAGWFAAPALSRAHYIVQVAEQVALEESQRIEESALQSDAFRKTGVPIEQLFQDAQEIQDKFRIGSALFGLWCGLAAALKIVSILTRRRRKEYEADRSSCLACGRCFLSCPVERQRLKRAEDKM